MNKDKWKKFLENGDIISYLEFKKEQKKDSEMSRDREHYDNKRRDCNKK